MTRTLVVDGANVVGSRPDGWWRDRPGAAARLHTALQEVDLGHDRVVLVLEGQARAGVEAGRSGTVDTVHAARDGDSAIIDVVRAEVADTSYTVVTADRGLTAEVERAGATVIRPSWLRQLLQDAADSR